MSDAMSSSGPRTDGDAEKATFIIQSGSSTGTGFLFHDNRHILTAYHVVEGTKQHKVKVSDVSNPNAPQDYYASIQKTWQDRDIALLYLDEPFQGVQPFTLALPKTLHQNTEIRTWGFPGIFGAGWHLAKIAGGPHNGKYDIDFETDYPDTLQGLSGGPVLPAEKNLPADIKYLVVGVMSNHGPINWQKGKIVSTEVFYSELHKILAEQTKSNIWCYIVRSEADVEKERKKNPYTLKGAVELALKNDPQVQNGTKPLEFEIATDLVSTVEKYQDAVEKICKARIAIFDITRFEPAIMLLLGVRSVVRRGITIASTGDNIIGDAFDIPFNIKELTIISHSEEQYNQAKKPPKIIRDKIERGTKQLIKLPQYLDLPVFDAVRNLPPEYRTPELDSVLILCPYSKKYQGINWKLLDDFLSPSLSREETSDTSKDEPRIMRILDLMSPRLVSSTIYEAIRRNDLCLVDWTEWRANVFFEFGVRLAVSGPRGFTVCIIEDAHKHLMQVMKESTPSDEDFCTLARVGKKDLKEIKLRYTQISEQCNHLLKLFDPLEYNTSPKTQDFDRSAYDKMMYYYKHKENSIGASSQQRYGRAPDFTYEVIEQHIDFKEESVSVPVYTDLLRTAELFGVESAKSQTVVLYPKNPHLNSSVETGITQRLLAAWYYLRQECKDEKEIIKDENLYEDYQKIGSKLRDYIQNSRPTFADEIGDILEDLLQKKENAHE